MNKSKPPTRPRPPRPPEIDLGQWLGERRLAQWALDAVLAQETAGGHPSTQGTEGCQRRMLLTLLSYCYARGWYGSSQIEQAIVHDPMVRYLCAHRYPDWKELRRFRREHRETLAACLGHLFQNAWAIKLEQTGLHLLGFPWFETGLTGEIDHEIQLRIDLASYMDLMEVDN